MFNIMYARYVLTIGALVIITMMDVLYFSKPKISTKIQHKAYAALIIANTCILLFECVIMFAFGLDMPFGLCTVFLQLRDLSMVAYFSFVLLYYYAAVNEGLYKDLRSMLREETFTGKRNLLFHFIFTMIFIIVHLFLPYDYVTKETYNLAFGGPAFYGTILYCVVTTLETIFMILFVSKRKINFTEKASLIWLFCLMLVILICQPLFSEMAVMGIISAIYVLGLYFLLENPDLEMVETIDSLTKEIDNANKTKFDFLSSISREMVNPISTITELSDTMLSDEEMGEGKLRTNIKQIELASKNFLEIINNSLDISNVDGDRDGKIESNYSLIGMLDNLVANTKEKITSEKVELVLNIDNSTPNNLYGDVAKISQILTNVLSNAIKYTDVGKISMSLTNEIKNSEITLKFKISDTGFGIKEEDYDKVFQRYARLDEAVSSGKEGSGLGLAIAKSYVDLLNGKIWFDSVYGAGTTFYIDIPQKFTDATATIESVKKAEAEYAAEGNKKLDCSDYRILIVEDDHLNLEVTKRLFARYGFKIETCSNGRECVFNYKKGEHYDMILLDHMMPEMSGIQVMQIIRKLKDYQTPPLVALTANTFTGSRDMYLEEGFDEYLAKPIDVVELDRLVHKYFKKEIKSDD